MKVVSGQWSVVSKSILGFVFCAMLFALCSLAEAHAATNVYRIGYLAGITAEAQSARIEAFRQGLRELGYMEGKNLVIEARYAEGNPIAFRRSRPIWCV
jgi:ABC-type uncharacterized transport system substrate-binding protein